MATIGNIVIGMSAKTETLRRDLNKGAAAVIDFGKRVGGAALRATADLAAIGGGLATAAGAGLGSLALKAGETIDKAGDLADRLGTTTANLMGPFWRDGSPATANGGSLVRTPGTPGEPVYVDAWVVDAQGRAYVGNFGFDRHAGELVVRMNSMMRQYDMNWLDESGEPINLMGASRTDAGVHAKGQVAAFTCSDGTGPDGTCSNNSWSPGAEFPAST